jgi:sulfocyanin
VAVGYLPVTSRAALLPAGDYPETPGGRVQEVGGEMRVGCRRLLWMIVCAGLVLAALPGAIGPSGLWAAGTPAWVRADAAHTRVSFTVKGADGGANGTLNFNGYANGQMTVTVPVGWTVRIDFINTGAGALPHSLEVIREVAKIPPQGIPPAIPKAESRDLIDGVPPLQSDSFEFTAQPAGRYLWFCGIPTHGVSGMWDRFVVSETASRPTVTVK